jgi:formamidopyrimidine-DNA glycosylase
MPEGDTVFLAATRLHAALAGERLVATEFRVPRPVRAPRDATYNLSPNSSFVATADLRGQTVREVAAHGKHLLLRTDAGVTLHSHLKMEGAWHLYRPGERWRGPDFQVRVVLRTAPWVAVGFRLGVCELLPTAREQEVVGHLGPDVLGPDWDAAEAVRRLRADPDRAVGTALLDQRVMAGPGNIYKCEVCFLRGVDPWTPVGQVDDLPGMVDLLKRLMEANRTGGRQVTTGDTRPGRSHWVAGRNGKPCRRCGTPIRKAEQESGAGYEADRVTWWCPTCQPGPGPARPAGGRRPLRSARTSGPRRGGRGGQVPGPSG